MGMKSATSLYACLWCKIHKDSRWKMNFDLEHYNSCPLKRTMDEINAMANKAGNKEKYSCENTPLINIDLEHVILDELHLLLRIMDVLIGNLVKEVIQWDTKDNFQKKKCDKKYDHLNKLQSTFRSCGVSFDIWEKTTEDGKGSGQYDFTSLLGSDKKKLLADLPDKLKECIQPETCQDVIDIWKSFQKLCKIITNKDSTSAEVTMYFEMSKEWINKFTSLRNKLLDYKGAAVTPYMHALVCHIPIFMQKYNSVKLFTGQGVEKNNDTARNVVLRKSNKQDSAADVLKLESRQWQLRHRERMKRSYTKYNTDYWETGIKEKRKK